MTKINQIKGIALWLAYCEKKQEVENQQQEIADLTLALADLNEHDDEIKAIEDVNNSILALADVRIDNLIDENNTLKARIVELLEREL